MFPWLRASCDVEVYFSVFNICGVKGFFEAFSDFFDVNAFYFNGVEALCEPGEVFFKGKDFAVVAAYDLVDAVTKENSSVEVHRLYFREGDDFVLYHC